MEHRTASLQLNIIDSITQLTTLLDFQKINGQIVQDRLQYVQMYIVGQRHPLLHSEEPGQVITKHTLAGGRALNLETGVD